MSDTQTIQDLFNQLNTFPVTQETQEQRDEIATLLVEYGIYMSKKEEVMWWCTDGTWLEPVTQPGSIRSYSLGYEH